MLLSFSRMFSFICLFLICAFLWLLQSLSTLNQFLDEEGGEVTHRKVIPLEKSKLPGIVICNELPYAQANLNSFGKSLNHDSLRLYLKTWLNPSTIDSPDYVSMNEDDRKIAETTITQLLPNTGLKQRLDQILLKCQDFVSSCVIRGESMSGFECCEHVEPFLATLNGVCWIFKNKTFQQNVVDSRFGIQITFQITKNSFISSVQNAHPGLTIYLISNDETQSRLSIATQLSTQNYMLKDKRQVRVFVQKQIETNRRLRGCLNHQQLAFNNKNNNSSFVACLVEAAVQQCACVPLIAVLWTLQGDLDVSFLRRFDVSSICTVEEYSQCAQKYISQSNPERWLSFRSLNNFPNLKHSVDHCRRTTRMPCQRTTFQSLQMDETDLPQEYKSTQDFVSRISIAYDSLDVTEIVYDRLVDLRQTLTIIGYNFATWFAIGHLIWSFMNWFFSLLENRPSKHKVQPRQSMVITSPIQIRPRTQHEHHQQLPPLEIQAQATAAQPDVKAQHNGHPRPQPQLRQNQIEQKATD